MQTGELVRIKEWQSYVEWSEQHGLVILPRIKTAIGILNLLRDDGTAAVRYTGFYVGTIPQTFLEVVSGKPDMNRLKTATCPKCAEAAKRIGLHMQSKLGDTLTIATYHCSSCNHQWQQTLTSEDLFTILEESD